MIRLGDIELQEGKLAEICRRYGGQKPAVIGEAAACVSDELKARHPDVPWRRIVAFRNILVHAYLGVDGDVVWLAVSRQVPYTTENCSRCSTVSARSRRTVSWSPIE